MGEEGGWGGRGFPVERYVPPVRYDRYDRWAPYQTYYPPAFLHQRPLARYTPAPRYEYRAHVEYLGSSGGRYVSRERRAECCATRRIPPHLPLHHAPPPPPPIWRSVGQSPPSPSPSQPPTPSVMEGAYSRCLSAPGPETVGAVGTVRGGGGVVAPPPAEPPPPAALQQQQQQQQAQLPPPQPPQQQQQQPRPQLMHQQSTPVTQAEINQTYYRSSSRAELFKNAVKREVAVWFGVDSETEETERERWEGRRRRLATRRYGQLKSTPHTSQVQSQVGQPDVLPLDSTDGRWGDTAPRQKPSVAKMTFSGMAYVVSALNRHRTRTSVQMRSSNRSYPPSSSLPPSPASPLEDDVFFDRVSTGLEAHAAPPAEFVDGHTEPQILIHERPRERHGSWRRAPEGRIEEEGGGQVGMSRISGRLLDRALDNSDRRTYGMGILNRFFSRSLKRSVARREAGREELEDLEDHRPFFTYWITTVQILILFISIVCYGFGPIGINLHHQSGLVLVTSLALQQVEYDEPANFYIGPRAADLIHLGAKFAPCMRRDAKIMKEIEKGREKERETACCIRNDDSGCVQSSKADCSLVSSRNHLTRGLSPTSIIKTWKKWSLGDSGPGGRISGSVCGLDPKYCEAPASVAPYEWPDDITKWPICRKTASSGVSRPRDRLAAEHMVCEVIGHPCCIGIHATCHITTKEYCDFVHGYFHEEASLCSQVSCLDDVCGMMPFFSPEVPDQFYRLLTSIFLHAGLVHLAISVAVQWFVMRDLEKFTGTFRIMIIYFGSGIGGNLASAIFVPYRADVGPAGSQFGLLACLVVEVVEAWRGLARPSAALLRLLALTTFLFLLGLLPWVDNFSHLFGFLFGFLLSYALLPFASLGPYDRHKKVFLVWVCLLTSLCLFLLLLLFFYVVPVYDCRLCSYLNCVPLTRDFCASQDIDFKRPPPASV